MKYKKISSFRKAAHLGNSRGLIFVNLHTFGIVPTLLSLLTDINNPFLSFNSNIYKVYLDFIIPRSHPPWSNRGPWGVPLPCFNSKTLLLFQKILFLPI